MEHPGHTLISGFFIKVIVAITNVLIERENKPVSKSFHFASRSSSSPEREFSEHVKQ